MSEQVGPRTFAHMEANGLHIPHLLQSRLVQHLAAHPESWARQLRWFAAAAVISFAVPFLGSSVFGLQHDIYLGIYFVVVLAVFAAYVWATGLDVRATVRRQWKLGGALGIITGALLVATCCRRTRRPGPTARTTSLS
jgi:hypothetical protein